MTTYMRSWTWVVGVVLVVVFLGGCASVSVTRAPRSESPPPTVRVDDARPIAAIRAENAKLRARQAELETSHQQWQVAVAQEERTKKDLKTQKDRVEDDLKQAKKRAKKS